MTSAASSPGRSATTPSTSTAGMPSSCSRRSSRCSRRASRSSISLIAKTSPRLDHEPDHVPGQAALPDLDQPVVGPLGQRLVPRQREQARRGLGRRREDETHRLGFPRSVRQP